MSVIVIVLFICVTALCIAIVVSRTIEKIKTNDSYWKVKYELEKSYMYSIQKLNGDIIENTKNVIKINEELMGMFKAYYKEKETPTNEAAE